MIQPMDHSRFGQTQVEMLFKVLVVVEAPVVLEEMVVEVTELMPEMVDQQKIGI